MTKILVLKRKRMAAFALVLIAAVAAGYWIYNSDNAIPVFGNTAKEAQVYEMAAIEIVSTLADGTETEIYQWFPETIHVNKGENVELRITGIHGESHPFIIEGLQIKEEVRKGEETVVRFDAAEKGTYKLICLTHHSDHANGPMVADIVVE